jgi:hypothetical protein
VDRVAWIGALVAIGLGACRREGPPPPRGEPAPGDAAPTPGSGDVAPTAGPGAAAPARGPLTLDHDGEAFVLEHARAYRERDALTIRISDVPGPCGDGFRPPWRAAAFIRVPAGPGGGFFAGAPFGTQVSAGPLAGAFSAYAPGAVRVELEPFVAEAGARIAGRLELPHGGGRFDAELCPGDYGALAPLPAQAPEGPVAGQLGAQRFQAVKGLAIVHAHGAAYRELGRLILSAGADVSCATYRDREGPAMLVLTDIGGAGSSRRFTGAPQPARARVGVAPGQTPSDGAPAWITFDELGLEAGQAVRGRLVAQSASEALDVGGHFVAEVCPD